MHGCKYAHRFLYLFSFLIMRVTDQPYTKTASVIYISFLIYNAKLFSDKKQSQDFLFIFIFATFDYPLG